MTQNFSLWVDELATTDKPQAEGKLCGYVKDASGNQKRDSNGDLIIGYCCLGIGYDMMEDKDPAYAEYLEPNRASYPPPEFLKWLGLRYDYQSDDVVIDWPPDLIARPGEFDDGDPMEQHLPGGADLNDNGFTFAQIADVLGYFGIKGMVDE